MRKTISLMLTLMILMTFFVNISFAATEKTLADIEKEPIKKMSKDESIPAKWDLQKPKVEPHEDIPLVTASNGDGSNNISFDDFESGNIIVVTGTVTGHAGEFDWVYYYDLDSYCIWSANTEPVNGVQLEQPSKYRSYDEAYGLWVPSATDSRREHFV